MSAATAAANYSSRRRRRRRRLHVNWTAKSRVIAMLTNGLMMFS